MASARVNGSIITGSVDTATTRRWRCGHSSAAITAPSNASLARPLAKLASACRENSRAIPATGEMPDNLGMSGSAENTIAVLDGAAGERRQRQHEKRNAQRASTSFAKC